MNMLEHSFYLISDFFFGFFQSRWLAFLWYIYCLNLEYMIVREMNVPTDHYVMLH